MESDEFESIAKSIRLSTYHERTADSLRRCSPITDNRGAYKLIMETAAGFRNAVASVGADDVCKLAMLEHLSELRAACDVAIEDLQLVDAIDDSGF